MPSRFHPRLYLTQITNAKPVIAVFILKIKEKETISYWAKWFNLIPPPIPRNAEILLKLINLGKLPPDAKPPLDLLDNPTSIYNTWFNGLPQHIKSMVLHEVTECNIETQFLKVSKNN